MTTPDLGRLTIVPPLLENVDLLDHLLGMDLPLDVGGPA